MKGNNQIIRRIRWWNPDRMEEAGGGVWYLADSREMLQRWADEMNKEHPEFRHAVVSSTKSQVYGDDESTWPTEWPAPDPVD